MSRPWYFIGRLMLVSLFIGSLAVVGARPYLEPKETGDFVFISDVSRSMTARHSCGEPTFLARDIAETDLRWILSLALGVMAGVLFWVLEVAFHQSQIADLDRGSRERRGYGLRFS